MSTDHWTFPWQDTAEVLTEQNARQQLTLDDRHRYFRAPGLRISPPLVLPIHQEVDGLADYVRDLPASPSRHFVILLQAGAASLGVFEHGEQLATKSIKKYVVRGRGRAQPTHLASKGKSRYGSRLRLQNAHRLFDEVNQRLHEWVKEFGTPQEIFYNAPVRLWTSLLTHDEPPPFGKNERLIKIPHDLPVPTTEILVRTYRKMSYGRVDLDPEIQ